MKFWQDLELTDSQTKIIMLFFYLCVGEELFVW